MSAQYLNALRVIHAYRFLKSIAPTLGDGTYDTQNDSFYQKNLYLFLGRSDPWPVNDNPSDPFEFDESDTRDKMLAFFKLEPSMMSLGIRRIQWEEGMRFVKFRGNQELDLDAPFYCTNSRGQVFLCLDTSTDELGNPILSKGTEPEIGVNPLSSIYHSADQMIWKYVGTTPIMSEELQSQYYLPVERIHSDANLAELDSTQQTQKRVQDEGQNGTISSFEILATQGEGGFIHPVFDMVDNTNGLSLGTEDIIFHKHIRADSLSGKAPIQIIELTQTRSGFDSGVGILISEYGMVGNGARFKTDIDKNTGSLNQVMIIDSGTDYSQTVGVVCLVVGSCSRPAVIQPVIQGGKIIQMSVYDSGSGYTIPPRVFVIPGTYGAYAKAVMAPTRGLGADIFLDCLASTLILMVDFRNETSVYFRNIPSFRQIGLISELTDSDGQLAGAKHYLGPSHPDADNNTLMRANSDSGIVLYLDNQTASYVSDLQDKVAKIFISF